MMSSHRGALALCLTSLFASGCLNTAGRTDDDQAPTDESAVTPAPTVPEPADHAQDAGGIPARDLAPSEIKRGITWLDHLNGYRSMAGLPALTEEPVFSRDALAHAKYIVRTGTVGHDEDPASPHFTLDGKTAAMSSDVLGAYKKLTFDQALDQFAATPFHALQIFNPALSSTGFADFTEEGHTFRYAAVLDVRRGMRRLPADVVATPTMFPGEGAIVPIRTSLPEYPDPLTACRGYAHPAGLPVIVQLGEGKGAVKSHTLQAGETALEHCVYDASSYVNPDATAQSVGRALLKAANAVIIVPRAPLTAGRAYSVQLAAGDRKMAWSFRVAADAQ